MTDKGTNPIERAEVIEQVKGLLKEAEEKKASSYPEAIKILYDAANVLAQLKVDEKKSDKNMTQDRDTLEIKYMSKRGNVLYELKEFEESKKCYEFIKQKLPNNTEVHKSVGDCLRKLKRFAEASTMYDRGLTLYEKDDVVAPNIKAALLNSRGLNYMEQKKYVEAKNDFEAAVKIGTKNPNPLHICNKAYALYALDQKGEALKMFEEVNGLINSGQKYGLTEQNFEYIKKTFEELVNGLKNLKSVELKKPDAGIQGRELNFIKSNIEAMTPQEGVQGEKVPEASGIVDAKKYIQNLEKDLPLFEYYDGFMFTLAQSFSTATVITSGQVLINTDNSKKIDILASAMKLVPLVGSHISEGLKSWESFAQGSKVSHAATNITKFTTSEGTFLEIVQEALFEVIKDKQDQIRAQKDSDLENIILPKWASRFQKIINEIKKLNGKVDEMLYGERSETPLQKLGVHTAHMLISEHVANGAIYNGEVAVRIPKDKKKSRLTQIAKDLFDKSLDPKELQLTELSMNTESGGSCAVLGENCSMF